MPEELTPEQKAAVLDETAGAADWLAGLADADDAQNGGTNGPRIHSEASTLRAYADLWRAVGANAT